MSTLLLDCYTVCSCNPWTRECQLFYLNGIHPAAVNYGTGIVDPFYSDGIHPATFNYGTGIGGSYYLKGMRPTSTTQDSMRLRRRISNVTFSLGLSD
jgi:hypothetical protein